MKNSGNVARAEDTNSWNDAKMEGLMGNLLRAGVLISAFVVACGGVLYLVQYGGMPPHHTVFKGEPADMRSIPGIVRDTTRGGSRGIIQFGLLLLIATPIARVVFAAYAFGRERDRLYVGISLTVLAVLIYGIVSPYL